MVGLNTMETLPQQELKLPFLLLKQTNDTHVLFRYSNLTMWSNPCLITSNVREHFATHKGTSNNWMAVSLRPA